VSSERIQNISLSRIGLHAVGVTHRATRRKKVNSLTGCLTWKGKVKSRRRSNVIKMRVVVSRGVPFHGSLLWMVHIHVGHVRDSGDITEDKFFSVNERFCEKLGDVMWSQLLGSNTRYTGFLQLTYKGILHNACTVTWLAKETCNRYLHQTKIDYVLHYRN